jgi:hypothetical protein
LDGLVREKWLRDLVKGNIRLWIPVAIETDLWCDLLQVIRSTPALLAVEQDAEVNIEPVRRFKHANKTAQGLHYFWGPKQAAVYVQKVILVGGRSIDVVYDSGQQNACSAFYLHEKEIDKHKLIRDVGLVLDRLLHQIEE